MSTTVGTKQGGESVESMGEVRPSSEFHHPPSEQCIHDAMQGVIDQVPPPMFALPTKANIHISNKNSQLTIWTGLSSRAVERYLHNHAPATDKGHVRRHKKGI